MTNQAVRNNRSTSTIPPLETTLSSATLRRTAARAMFPSMPCVRTCLTKPMRLGARRGLMRHSTIGDRQPRNDYRLPTTRSRLSPGCRMSDVECRPMPAALTSSPTCVCRCSWDTPGSSRMDCRHSPLSLLRTCAWALRIWGILGRRFRQLPCRAPQAAPSSDAR